MDTVNYILFKNPLVTYSWSAMKYAAANVSAVAGPTYTTAPNPVSTLTKSQILQILQLHRNYLRLAGIFGASAVILGAYGAHTLLAKEGNQHRKKVFETASQYHFYHTVAILTAPLAKFPKLTAITMASGIIIFCGSCYYQSLTGDETPKKITPYGGSLLILSWLTLLL